MGSYEARPKTAPWHHLLPVADTGTRSSLLLCCQHLLHPTHPSPSPGLQTANPHRAGSASPKLLPVTFVHLLALMMWCRGLAIAPGCHNTQTHGGTKGQGRCSCGGCRRFQVHMHLQGPQLPLTVFSVAGLNGGMSWISLAKKGVGHGSAVSHEQQTSFRWARGQHLAG